jgi:hypothetical protein
LHSHQIYPISFSFSFPFIIVSDFILFAQFRLVTMGTCQCILGNHELNILRNEKIHGNRWWWGENEVLCRDSNHVSFQTLLTNDSEREEFRQFLLSLPLALERKGLRVVHAMWDNDAIVSVFYPVKTELCRATKKTHVHTQFLVRAECTEIIQRKRS